MTYAIGIMQRSITEILEDFSQPIPQEYLKTKPVFKNKQKVGEITYAPWGSYVQLLLKYCPGYCWQIRTQYFGDKVVVEGSLTIKAIEGDFIYEATGVQDTENNNYGDAIYDAESSALRRACAKAGLGLHLWRNQNTQKNYNYSSNQTNKNYQNSDSFSNSIVEQHQNKLTTKKLDNNSHLKQEKKVTEPQLTRLYTIGNKGGIGREEVKKIIVRSGYQSSKDILFSDYERVVNAVEKAIKAKTQPWVNWKSEDDAIAYAMNELDGMPMNQITQEWNKLEGEEVIDKNTGKARKLKGRAWVQRVQELKATPF